MAITVSDLIKELQTIQAAQNGDLIVVTDQEVGIDGAEYNDTEGSPAVILVTE